MKSSVKIIGTYAFAFFSAAAVPTLILSSIAGITDGNMSFILVLGFGAVYASFLVLALALPTFLVFQHLGLVSLRTSVIAGFVIGCVPTAILPAYVLSFYLVTDTIDTLVVGVLGAIGGLVFWLVIRRATEDTLAEP